MASDRNRSAAWVVVLALGLLATVSCGIAGPSCTDESGPVFNAEGRVSAGQTVAYTVASPKNSNLNMRLTWTDTAAILGFSATITGCGVHTGCAMTTFTPGFGPGGPSPTPQPWPAGVREMLVDGSRGKTYRVEVTSDPVRDTDFSLNVTYRIACES